MKYLFKRNASFYYNRRVPDLIRPFDSRETIRISLKTDSREEASKRATILNEQIEEYWRYLASTDSTYQQNDFEKLVKLARLHGFVYQNTTKLSQRELPELVSRLSAIESNDINNKNKVKAILGDDQTSPYTLRKTFNRFIELTKDRTINKTPAQIKKWNNPRKRAIGNLTSVIGNLSVQDLKRDHIIAFRDWWIERVKKGMSEASANKDIIHVKNIIETVNENDQLGLDTHWLFSKMTLKEQFAQNRKPLDSLFIKETLLNENNLSTLNDEIKNILYALADTGARPAELLGLDPVDIVLDAKIPHIKIRNKKGKLLKTPYSERDIPLVGFALKAFKNHPNGFSKYRNKSDSFSGAANKYLRENNLLPSKQHTVYSLRHSFQDRLLAVNTPDRIQAELMGHKFSRPMYGEGGKLDHKFEWMKKISLG